jgi:GH24 family phage-related lysozyme (muramidase)
MKFLRIFILVLCAIIFTQEKSFAQTGDLSMLDTLYYISESDLPTEHIGNSPKSPEKVSRGTTQKAVEAAKMPTLTVPENMDAKALFASQYFAWTLWELKRREGFRSKPYNDNGCMAVGYGMHITQKAAETIKKKGGVTEPVGHQQIHDWFLLYSTKIESELPKTVLANANQVWAVKSLAYNIGFTNLKKTDLWTYIQRNDVSQKCIDAWLLTGHQTVNHRQSRLFEAHLWRCHKFKESKTKAQSLATQSQQIISSKDWKRWNK